MVPYRLYIRYRDSDHREDAPLFTKFVCPGYIKGSLHQTIFRNSTGNTLFRADFDVRPSWTKIRISSKKRVPGRISKNRLAHSIPESMENANPEVNGDASFRWSFGSLSAWGSIESTAILTTHPSLHDSKKSKAFLRSRFFYHVRLSLSHTLVSIFR